MDFELDLENRKLNVFSQDHCPGKGLYHLRIAGGGCERDAPPACTLPPERTCCITRRQLPRWS